MPTEVGWISGGVGGIIIAVGLILKYVLDYLAKRPGKSKVEIPAAAEVIANGPEWLVQRLQVSLDNERENVERLSGRIEELETQNAMLYERMRDQRREYEREIADLRTQMADMADRLEQLQRRLSVDPPEPA